MAVTASSPKSKDVSGNIEGYIERMQPFLFRIISSRVYDADVKDIAQLVLIKLWRYESLMAPLFWGLVSRGEDEAWLRKMTTNTVIDYYRRPSNRYEVMVDEFPTMKSSEPSAEDLLWEKDLIKIWNDLQKEKKRAPKKTCSHSKMAQAVRKHREKAELKRRIQKASHKD